jgi:hypothetical protein
MAAENLDGWMDGWKASRKTTTTSFTICNLIFLRTVIGGSMILTYFLKLEPMIRQKLKYLYNALFIGVSMLGTNHTCC